MYKYITEKCSYLLVASHRKRVFSYLLWASQGGITLENFTPHQKWRKLDQPPLLKNPKKRKKKKQNHGWSTYPLIKALFVMGVPYNVTWG